MNEQLTESKKAVGWIKIDKHGNRVEKSITKIYTSKNYALEFAPQSISFKGRTYLFKYPLRCLFDKEEDYYLIQSEMLGIIGTGPTEAEAEESFSQEFDFLFQRFKTLKDDQLTNHMILIKNILSQIVLKVE